MNDVKSDRRWTGFFENLGWFLTGTGILLVILLYAAFITGSIYRIWTHTNIFGLLLAEPDWQKSPAFEIVSMTLFAVSLPILALGTAFVLFGSNWKFDLRFTLQKFYILLSFILFFPVCILGGLWGGFVPLSFFCFHTGMLLIGADYLSFFSVFYVLICLVEFLLYCGIGHLFACLLIKYANKKLIATLVTILTIGSLLGVYIWGDAGGGSHYGNIFQLSWELLRSI